MEMGYIHCAARERDRMVPFGNTAEKGVGKLSDKGAGTSPKRQTDGSAVYQLLRRADEPSGFLETDQVLWEEGGDRIRDHTAYAAPFVCGTSDQQWSRFKVGAGDVRTF